MPTNDEIDRRAADVRALFGALPPEQEAVVRERIDAALQAGEAMRAVSLDNGVDPFAVFARDR